MRYRACLSLAILVVTACSVGVDGPVAVESPDVSPAFGRDGVKPPPPLSPDATDIEFDSPSSETPGEGEISGGPSASDFANLPFFAHVRGRYFANKPGTNGWIAFESDDCVIASANAKLQYNEKNGKTQGHGTLTNCDGVVVDLRKIVITSGGFGDCELNFGEYTCRSFSFSYNGIPGGEVTVGSSDE